MKNKQKQKELEEQIAALQAELRNHDKWVEEDIVPGMVVAAEGHSTSVILLTGYAKYGEEPVYYFGGLSTQNPFVPFSNGPYTLKKLVEYLNKSEHRFLGMLETNFVKLDRNK